jgi:hypothetical protein
MYEYKVNNSPQTSWVALARATLEESINAAAGPAPLPLPLSESWSAPPPVAVAAPLSMKDWGEGRFRGGGRRESLSRSSCGAAGGYGSCSYGQIWEANCHRWILWMPLGMPQTFFSLTGSVGGCWCARIMEAVLGFLSRQDKYLLNACHRWSEYRVSEGSAD